MKKPLILIAALALSFAGCAGQGGSGNAIIPQSGNSAPDLGGVVSPDYVNSSLPYYVPLMKGNTWTLTANTFFGPIHAYITDMGPYQVNKNPNNATWQSLSKDERIDVSSDAVAGSYVGTMYVRKVKYLPTGHELTTITGESTNGNTSTPTVSLLKAPLFPLGIPIMDDIPHKGESWSVASLSGTSKVDAIIAHVPYNSQFIANVAEDVLSAPSAPVIQTVTWRFAKGVGPVQIDLDGYTFLLTKFAIGKLNSHLAGAPVTPFTVSNKQFSLEFLQKLVPQH